MATTLSQLAEEARAAEVERDRARRAAERNQQLDRVITKFHDEWGGFGRLEKEGLEVECPEREAFTRRTEVLDWSGSRDERVYGWEVEIDGLRWLFATEYPESVSLRLLHTCPRCGVEGASDFHTLADLGALLRNGPKSYTHRCLDRESRGVAYAIGTAARDTNLSAEEIVEAAFERHSDLILRLMRGRQ